MVSSRPFVIWLLLSFIFTLTSAVQSPMDTSTQLSLHVYTRPNGQGQVQHIRAKQLQQDTSACFNLLSRHTGAIDMNDPHLRISFYRSKDCKGIPIRRVRPLCQHRSKVMVRAQSVSISRLTL